MNEQLVKTLRASNAQTTGTVTGDTTNGGIIVYEEVYKEAVFVLDVTALDTDAGDTLDVYIDVSFDGGVTWVNAVHFPQQSGTGSPAKYIALLKNEPAIEDLHTVTTDVAAGSTRQIGMGTQLRYRGVVANTSTADATFTYSLVAFLK